MKEDRSFWIAIGQQIRERRKAKGMRLIDLSAKTDMDKANLIRIEKGTAQPATTTLLRIAEALNTTLQIQFIPNEGVERR